MGAVLESDIYCEAICDGRHLHPGTVRFLIKMKGMDRMVGITDSIMAAGLPDGNYKLGVNDVVVVDGDAPFKGWNKSGKYADHRTGIEKCYCIYRENFGSGIAYVYGKSCKSHRT